MAGLPFARAIGLALAIGVACLAPSRMRGYRWDYPRSSLVLHLIDEPFFISTCASLMAAPAIVLWAFSLGIAHLVDATTFSWALLPRVSLIIYAFFVVMAAWGVWIRRRWVKVRRMRIAIRELPESFEGFTIAHLSDLHLGGLTPSSMVRRWVEITNSHGADLVALTGDYVTSGSAFHSAIAEVLGDLRAKDGVVFSMGNHDYFDHGEPMLSLLAERGLRAVRNTSFEITRGSDRLRIAGIDDTYTRRAELDATMAATMSEAALDAGARKSNHCPTIVLAHNPELFGPLVERGADLVLSGHTHGGQVALPGATRIVNFVRLAHTYVVGMYASGDATLVVHAGLGTTGPPIRLGVAPEILLLSLTRR